ncbi:MAG: hypothetical protein WCB46_12380 [Methanoregula sp.]
MDQKVLTGILAGIICILFIICAACASLKEETPVPTLQTTAPAETPTGAPVPVTILPVSATITAAESNGTPMDKDGTLARDAAFDLLFAKSADEITNKTDLVIFEMSQSGTLTQLGYSPVRLYLAAEDLGYTTENYYNVMLNTRANTPENEVKRIEYIQFLYIAKNAAYHIADAASAESSGNYENAQAMANAAILDLRPIKVNPNLPPLTSFNRLLTYLYDYTGQMNEKIALQQSQQTNKIPQRGGFSPSLPEIPRRPS